MANLKKYTRKDLIGNAVFRHFERAKDENSNYYQWGNQSINSNLSHLNYNLAPSHELGHGARFLERLKSVKCQNRADVYVLCSWVLTAPKGLPEHEHDRFFKLGYDFFAKKYGEVNVVSAYVHKPETTPHMHFAFIPVVKDKKRGHEKVSAKEAIHGENKKGLHEIHPELSAYMTKAFGRDIGVINEATRDGNKEIQQLKREAIIAEAKAELEKALKPIQTKITKARRIKRLAKSMTEKSVSFLRKTPEVVISDTTAEEMQTVFDAALRVDEIRKMRDNAIKAKNSAIEAKKTAETQRNAAIEARDKAQAVVSEQIQKEIKLAITSAISEMSDKLQRERAREAAWYIARDKIAQEAEKKFIPKKYEPEL